MKAWLTKEIWEKSVLERIVAVGDCEEWQGRMMGKTPVVTAKPGFAFEGSSSGSMSVRVWVYAQAHGARPPDGKVIRMNCRNDRCCAEGHMVLFTRGDSVREMSRRGELDTPACRAGKIKSARNRPTKLTAEIARIIRVDPAPSMELAQRYGVSKETINAVRRGERWPEAANGASVFNWRPAA